MFPISDDERDARNDAWLEQAQSISSQEMAVQHVGTGDLVQLCADEPFLEVIHIDDLPSGFVRLHFKGGPPSILHRDENVKVEVVNLKL